MGQFISPKTSETDMALCGEHFGRFISAPEALPVSFLYNGCGYKGLPAGSSVKRKILDANMFETIYSADIDELLTITAECVGYRDYPVVEYTVYFTNHGANDSGVLEGLCAIDTIFNGKNPTLVYNNGDGDSVADWSCVKPEEYVNLRNYTVSSMSLAEGVEFAQLPIRGLACDKAFPYQRVLFDGFGFNISIGWPGEWFCKYMGLSDGFSFKAGQKNFHTIIRPGETMRTPRMTLMAFEGDQARGTNVWRRWFNAHVTPRSRGDIIGPISTISENGGGVEFLKADEQNQVEAIGYAKEHLPAMDVWWIDAGWYPSVMADGTTHWRHTGTWKPDPERFPNGLAPVGKACEDTGLNFLLWFEPERVRTGSELGDEHPDWLLSSADEPDVNSVWSGSMLNLSIPECRRWLIQRVSSIIREGKVKIYRQDCNFALDAYWRNNEEKNRTGALENLYVQGYLQYWDDLLWENPNLWIDSCASGGRRNDMETMRRSVSLHPTDWGYGCHHMNQSFRHTLASWFPYTRGWVQSWDTDGVYKAEYGKVETHFDNYMYINGFGCLTSFPTPSVIKRDNEQLPYYKKMHGIWKEFAPIMLHGDFYALTENHRDTKKWTVFQFDLPEAEVGAIQALRNNQCSDDSIAVNPAGFDNASDYSFINRETGKTFIKSGREINDKGLVLSLAVRSGAIWFYRRIVNLDQPPFQGVSQ